MNKLFLMAAVAVVFNAGCNDDDDDNPTPGSGCNSAPLVFINSGDTVVMPNAFTPNGDGRNDRLRLIHGTDDSLSGTLTIYQQGNELFSTSELNSGIGWDGKNSSGVVLPEGSFQVKLKLNQDDGGTYEDTRCLRLINPGVSGCIDTSMYRFEDQYGIMGSNGIQIYQTGEAACP